MKVTEAVERALALSRADACVVIATETSVENARWANNTATTNGSTETTTLSVISVRGASVGMRATQRLDDLEDVVRASEAACEGTPPVADVMPLPDEAFADEWEIPSAPVGHDGIGTLAHGLGETFRRATAEGTDLFGYAEHIAATTTVATSTGGRRRYRAVDGSFECTGKTADRSRSSWTGQVTRDYTDVDPDAHLTELQRRLAWGERRIELPAGPYEVLLERSAAADMILYMNYAALAERDAQEGRTVFSREGGTTAIGERIAPPGLSLRSDPGAPGIEVAPFRATLASTAGSSIFDNGLSRGPVEWISSGVLRSLARPRWRARDGAPEIPAPSNLILSSQGPSPSMAEMIAATERALLVTTVWYIREVDPKTLLLTGLTRDGVYLVEGGEIVGEVNNFRFNVSPVTMLANAVEVGAPAPTQPREFEGVRVSIPPLRVAGWNMSTVSPAV
jgi:predicted Zn-dependent protease